jgi:general secretion pathway protein A
MFLNHFKMIDMPFSEKPPINGILKDDRIDRGLSHISYLASHATLGLITGNAGVGKSSLIRLFIDAYKTKSFNLIYLHHTHLKALSFLKILVTAMGEIPAHGKEKVFNQIQNKIKNNNLTTIVLIDEAHLLDSDAFIDLRLLVSSAIEDYDGLKIVLFGHSDINKELSRSRHESLHQRITIKYHLSPMTQGQTRQYIDFQIRRVNCSEKIFEEEVKNDIHNYARGIPRIVNQIATGCLINAYIENQQKINNGILLKTLKDIDIIN